MKYVFISAPYIGEHDRTIDSYLAIDENIANARKAMIILVNHGFGVFCPHTHSAHFEVITPLVKTSYWVELDLHFLRACNILLRLPGFSRGADDEVEEATTLDMPVYFDIIELIEKEGKNANHT